MLIFSCDVEMNDSELKSRFIRSDSFEQNSVKKSKGISFWMVFLAIFIGGVPVYTYLLLTGKMFEFDFVKNLHRPEPVSTYSAPSKKQTKTPPETSKKRLVSPKKSDEAIYSWVDENGVKKFSNIHPLEAKRDLVVTKAVTSTQSKKLDQESYISSASRVKETSVFIENNQILIPVRLGNNGKEISTLLLLDTGATTTSIHNHFADKFGYFDYKHSKSQIADGSMVDTKTSNFDYIIIGPYQMNNFKIVVMNYQGGPSISNGLLGMNFLKNVKYQIDYQRKIIKWF